MSVITADTKKLIINEHGHKLLVKSKERSNKFGEVFTPPELVIEMLEQLPTETWDDGKTFLDPASGDGNFIVAVLIVKQSLKHVNPLTSVYGVDLMEDNVAECKARLLAIAGDTPENRAIVENNILCRDGLTYDYSFGTSPSEQLFEW
jgi:type I restriction-modification system DNA methylase subunit